MIIVWQRCASRRRPLVAALEVLRNRDKPPEDDPIVAVAERRSTSRSRHRGR